MMIYIELNVTGKKKKKIAILEKTVAVIVLLCMF